MTIKRVLKEIWEICAIFLFGLGGLAIYRTINNSGEYFSIKHFLITWVIMLFIGFGLSLLERKC